MSIPMRINIAAILPLWAVAMIVAVGEQGSVC
jgi:hypothetical protein